MPSTLPTLAALFLAASTASAAITIPTVSVGDTGNVADGTGYGSVAYEYQIGTYEVTNSQYTAFLNAVAADDTYGLYTSDMVINQNGSPGNYDYTVTDNNKNKPVNHISFWDSARFANWLTNGQPTGSQDNSTTEDGAYTLTSDGITNNTVTRGSWYDESEGNTSNNTVFAVASDNEWYKAAYYDPTLNNGAGGYYDYPTQSNTAPEAESPSEGENSANYANAFSSVTNVGSYPNSGSYYGTFDQGGNVLEWNDSRFINNEFRGHRGGNFNSGASALISSATSIYGTPEVPLGSRVVNFAPIPEPSSYGAIFGIVGLAAAVFFRRRRRRE